MKILNLKNNGQFSLSVIPVCRVWLPFFGLFGLLFIWFTIQKELKIIFLIKSLSNDNKKPYYKLKKNLAVNKNYFDIPPPPLTEKKGKPLSDIIV